MHLSQRIIYANQSKRSMYFLVTGLIFSVQFSSFQLLSHVQLCIPIDCSMPGFPVHQQLPELAQICVHRTGDAIQPSHPLSSPSPPAFNVAQHQGLS